MLTRRDALRTEITRLARARPGHFERRAGRVARETSAPVTPRRLDHSRVVPIHLSRARRTFARHAASRPAGERRVRAFFRNRAAHDARVRLGPERGRSGLTSPDRERSAHSQSDTQQPAAPGHVFPERPSGRRERRERHGTRVIHISRSRPEVFSAPTSPACRAARAFAPRPVRLDRIRVPERLAISDLASSIPVPPRSRRLRFRLTLLALRQRAVAHHASRASWPRVSDAQAAASHRAPARRRAALSTPEHQKG